MEKLIAKVALLLWCCQGLAQNEQLNYFELTDTVFEKGALYQIENVEFDYNGAGILPEGKYALKKVIKFLAQNSNLIVEIRVHTDQRGNDKYNLILSDRRAQQLVDYLFDCEIPIQRLVAKGYGESEPYIIRQSDHLFSTGQELNSDFIHQIKTDSIRQLAYQMNRRIEMKILDINFKDTFNLFVDTFAMQEDWQKIAKNDSLEWKLHQEIQIPGVFFAYSSYTIQEQSHKILYYFAQFLRANKNLVIEIGNHSDCRGTDYYSVNYTQRRAESVVEYLVSLGIDKERLFAKGYGELIPREYQGTRLSCDFIEGQKRLEDQEKMHALNRRTSFKIIATDYQSP